MDDTLRRELVGMREDDRRVRSVLDAEGRLSRGYDPEMEAVHRRNAERLRGVLAAHGWPTRWLAGEDGAEAAWLVVQHAIGEPDFQRRVLPLLELAAQRGEIPAWHPAYLLDRIRMFEGWPQVFGTQMAPDVDGHLAVWPIEAAATLNDRRRAVGLPAFEERSLEAVSHQGADDGRVRRADMDAWARRVGWRRRILHVTTGIGWAQAIRAGIYAADSLATEGFIHCSEPQQATWVANDRFRGRQDLVLLQIAVEKLSAPVQYENLQGGTELFPHIYGPLDLDAVSRATPFPPRADGSFDHDQLAGLY